MQASAIAQQLQQSQVNVINEIIAGSPSPDVSERLLLYVKRGLGTASSSTAAMLQETEEEIMSGASYLASKGLLRIQDGDRHIKPIFWIQNDAKTGIDAYFQERFSEISWYILEFSKGPAEAGDILDIARTVPDSSFTYGRNFSMKRRDMKGFDEKVREKLRLLQEYERELLRTSLGIEHPVNYTALSHVKENDPYWKEHRGRPKDDEDVVFELQLNLDGISGHEITGMPIGYVSGNLPPYHHFNLKDEEGDMRLPKGKIYHVTVGNPFYDNDNLYLPKPKRDMIETRSQELLALFGGFL